MTRRMRALAKPITVTLSPPSTSSHMLKRDTKIHVTRGDEDVHVYSDSDDSEPDEQFRDDLQPLAGAFETSERGPLPLHNDFQDEFLLNLDDDPFDFELPSNAQKRKKVYVRPLWSRKALYSD